MLTWQDFLTLDILNLDSSKPELYLIKLHCCIFGIQGSYDYILLNSYEILLLTGTFWGVRRWTCSYVKTISLSTKQRYTGSGCFSVARDMLLSSLIVLSDQILSFGVKNIHVIICSNLSFSDHISYVAFLHSVIWAPPELWGYYPLRKALTYSSRGTTSSPFCSVSLEAFQQDINIYKLICTTLARM